MPTKYFHIPFRLPTVIRNAYNNTRSITKWRRSTKDETVTIEIICSDNRIDVWQFKDGNWQLSN